MHTILNPFTHTQILRSLVHNLIDATKTSFVPLQGTLSIITAQGFNNTQFKEGDKISVQKTYNKETLLSVNPLGITTNIDVYKWAK